MCNGGRRKSNDKEKYANFILSLLENAAVKNANKACRGFIYEPKLPRKLAGK